MFCRLITKFEWQAESVATLKWASRIVCYRRCRLTELLVLSHLRLGGLYALPIKSRGCRKLIRPKAVMEEVLYKGAPLPEIPTAETRNQRLQVFRLEPQWGIWPWLMFCDWEHYHSVRIQCQGKLDKGARRWDVTHIMSLLTLFFLYPLCLLRPRRQYPTQRHIAL